MRENPNPDPDAESAHIRICADSRVHSLLTDAISTKISCTGPGAIASHKVLMFNDPVSPFFISYRVPPQEDGIENTNKA